MEKYRYDVFGAPTILAPGGAGRPASIVSNRFLFTGREWSSMFGFYEYRNRAYHPGLGRFMSEDPKLFVRRGGLGKAADDWSFNKHADEAEFNLFRYCGNDPIDFTDPMGLLPDTNLTTLEARDLPPQVQVASLAVIGGAAVIGTYELAAGAALLNVAARIPLVARIVAPAIAIGNKVSYMLGEGTGNEHNIARSTGMAAQLRSIGLNNTPTGREYLKEALINAGRQGGGVLQDNGRVIKESLLMGPNGGAVLKTVWEGNKLITADVIKRKLKE